jgi:hypothetical protein
MGVACCAVLRCAVESLKPNLVVPSGAEVTVEMITHHAGDDPDKMIKVGPSWLGCSVAMSVRHPPHHPPQSTYKSSQLCTNGELHVMLTSRYGDSGVSAILSDCAKLEAYMLSTGTASHRQPPPLLLQPSTVFVSCVCLGLLCAGRPWSGVHLRVGSKDGYPC